MLLKRDSNGLQEGTAPSCASWAKSALLMVLLASTAAGHHAGTAYDQSKLLELNGTVSKFEFVNPHAYVYFIVQDAKGAQQSWRCELAASATLARLGWTKNTFTAGQKVTFKGAAGRNEPNVCVLNSFVMPNGQGFSAREDFTKGGPNPVATLTKNTARPARLANGRPNLSGPWMSAGNAADRTSGFMRGAPGMPATAQDLAQPTAAGAAAGAGYNQPFDDPSIKCDVGNILFGWWHDQHVNEIVQKDDVITLRYGYMDFVRTVYLNLAAHPQNIKPSRGGHSIGKWDGDVLVVDTVGLAPGVLNPLVGIMHSNQMHIVERFTLDAAAGTLRREFTAMDPLYLKGPVTGYDVSRVSDEPFMSYNCKELSGRNNIRPKS